MIISLLNQTSDKPLLEGNEDSKRENVVQQPNENGPKSSKDKLSQERIHNPFLLKLTNRARRWQGTSRIQKLKLLKKYPRLQWIAANFFQVSFSISYKQYDLLYKKEKDCKNLMIGNIQNRQ